MSSVAHVHTVPPTASVSAAAYMLVAQAYDLCSAPLVGLRSLTETFVMSDGRLATIRCSSSKDGALHINITLTASLRRTTRR
jgi:hypothetical protein